MTNEEIIKGLQAVNEHIGKHFNEGGAWMAEFIDRAINELERQTCEKPLKVRITLEEVTKNSKICAEERRQVAKYLRELQRMRNAVQSFLDQLEQNELVAVSTGTWNECIDDVEIFNAGGFTEKKRIGWTCSECGRLVRMCEKFCPSCGVKMEVKADEV